MLTQKKIDPLSYPFAVTPAIGDGSSIEIAPGLLWLRMPIMASLPSINVWAVAEGDAWTLVDTGMFNPAGIAAWERALPTALQGRPITRIVITHWHRDHAGMAGWLADRFGATLWMTRLEYLHGRLASTAGILAREDQLRFFKQAGWSDTALATYGAKYSPVDDQISPMPGAYRRLNDGDVIEIGGHKWRVIIGNGHSPEHACLYCAERKLLISGDQVLPRISSNVSVHATEPEANPLADWLASIEKLKREVPDDALVLPAHNAPFYGLHRRLDDLAAEHRRNLERLAASLSSERKAVEVFDALFARPITQAVLDLATGEAIAHLNWLVQAGRAVRSQNADGIYLWRATADTPT